MIQPLLLQVKEAATLLGVSRWTIHRMLVRGEIAWVPVGAGIRAKRIPRIEIDKWIAARMVRNGKDAARLVDGRRRP